MARISTYSQDSNVIKEDKLIGSDSGGETKNFSLESISSFFKNTNAAGVAGQLVYVYDTTVGQASGYLDSPSVTSFETASTRTFTISVFTFGNTSDTRADFIDTLLNKEILITNTHDPNNFGSFTVTNISTNGNFKTLTLSAPIAGKGSFISGKAYAISGGAGGGSGDLTEIQTSTSNQLTITNGQGPVPSLAIVTGSIANAGTGLATADQIHTFVTTQTDNIAASTTGNAATATKIASITNSDIVQLTSSQTLTNKTIDLDNNTLSNIELDNLKSGVLDTDLSSVAGTDTTIASAKAIKTYIDSQVDTVDTLSEILANGNTTGATNIVVQKSIQLPTTTTNTGTPTDQGVISFGGTFTNSNRIFNDASGGTLRIQGSGNLDLFAPNHRIHNSNGNLIQAGDNGVFLYYQNSEKLKTTSTGVTVTGDLLINTDNGGYFQVDVSDNSAKYADDIKAKFGTGNDLQMFHNGSNSFITNFTGNLTITNEANDKDIVFKSDDGSGGFTQYLTLDGSAEKILMHKSTVFTGGGMDYGVDGTGADVIFYGDTAGINMKWDQSEDHLLFTDDTKLKLGTGGDLQIFHNGTDSVIDNLTGDLYISNKADDKDIIFRSDDGSGGFENYIQIDGSAGRTLFNKHIRVNDNVQIQVGASADFLLSHDGTNTYASNNTGDLYIQQNVDDRDIIFQSDNGSGGITEYMRLDGSLGYTRSSKHIQMVDQQAFYAGSGNDLGIFHNGTNTYLQNLTGHLIIEQFADDKDIVFNSDDGSGGLTEYLKLDGSSGYTIVSKKINFSDDVELTLGSGNDLKLKHDGTNSSIINAVGNLEIRNNTDDGDISFYSDDGSGGTSEYMRLDGSQVSIRMKRITKWDDNIKAAFGDGSDLQIYHTGSASIIDNTTGSLFIRQFADNEDIRFECDDGSGGITEYFKLDGLNGRTNFSVDAQFSDNKKARFGNSADFQLYHTGTESNIYNVTGNLNISNDATDGDIIFKSDDGSGGLIEYFRLDGSVVDGGNTLGALSFPDSSKIFMGSGLDLRIYHDGSISYLQNATGNMIIQNFADDSDIIFKSDDGSGGTTEYFKLDGSATETVFSKDLRIIDSEKLIVGTDGDFQVFHNGSQTILTQQGVGNLIIQNTVNDADITFSSDDGSGGVTEYFRLDGSSVRTLFSQNTQHTDNVKAIFGNGDDLQIFHDGSNSFINDNGTGDLYIQTNGTNMFLRDSASGNTFIAMNTGTADVSLRQGGNTKLQTTSTGVTVTGNLVMGGGQVKFADTGKLMLGDSNDLQIFHDGSNSRINEIGTGNLIIQSTNFQLLKDDGGEFMMQGIADAEVSLYYDGSKKFETTNTGIDVAGVIKFTGGYVLDSAHSLRLDSATSQPITFSVADSEKMRLTSAGNLGIGTNSPNEKLTVNGNVESLDTFILNYNNAGNKWQQLFDGANGWNLRYNNGSSWSSNYINVNTSGNATFAGNVTISGNLTVDGTTTTLNTQTVEVEDNIIQLNTTQGSPDTATATTSGISVYRGDGITQASFIFDDADDTWDLTNNLAIAGSITIPQYINHTDDGNTNFGFGGADDFRVTVGGVKRLNVTTGGVEIAGNLSGATNATFTGDINISTGSHLFFDGGNSGTYITEDIADRLRIFVGATEFMRLTESTSDTINIYKDTTFAGAIATSGNITATASNATISAAESGGATTKIMGASVGRVGTSSNHNLEILSNNTAAITIDTSQNATFAGTVTGGNGTFTNLTINATEKLRFDGAGGHTYIEEDSNDTLIFATGGTTRLTLDANASFSGNITTSGNINAGSSNYLRFTAATSGSDASVLFGNTAGTGGSLTFKRNSDAAAILRLDADGNVGIGTSTPIDLLTITGDGKYIASHDGTNYAFRLGADSSGDGNFILYDSNGNVKVKLYGEASAANYINNGGNFGIGTSSPQALLHLSGTGLQGVQAWFGNGFINNSNYHYDFARVGFSVQDTDGADTGAGFHFNTRNSGDTNWMHGYIYQPQNGGIAFGTGGAGTTLATEKMRLTSTGNLGINTISPTEKLHISGGGSGNIRLDSGGTYYGTNVQAISSSGLKLGNDDFSGFMFFADDGTVGIGTNSPSQLLTIGDSSGNSFIDINKSTSGENGIIFNNAGNRKLAIIQNSSEHLEFHTNNNNVRMIIQEGGNVGIATTSPAAKLHVHGDVKIGGTTPDGAKIIGNKSVTLNENTFTSVLTVSMANHTSCYVKIFAGGDWSSHSGVAFLGEYFLQNGAGGYNEPGMIIREVDNTKTDSIVSKIVDPSGTSGNRDFVIQFKADDTIGSIGFAAKITYEVMGQFNSVT